MGTRRTGGRSDAQARAATDTTREGAHSHRRGARPEHRLAWRDAIGEHEHAESSQKGYKNLLPEKMPKDIICPLDSIKRTEIEQFKFRLDNYLFSGHPNIRAVVTGQLEPPLLSYQPYLDFMKEQSGADEYIFKHYTAKEDIIAMRAKGNENLAKECEIIMDNPPAYDGFRPCNSAIYFATLKTIKSDDLYIMRDVIYGDGITLRNLLWETMSGDEVKSKKLLAMSLSADITKVQYKFIRHGVKRYFADIHETLARLKTLGATKQGYT